MSTLTQSQTRQAEHGSPDKLKVAIAGLSESREMVIEGMIGIAQGENPRSIESKLQGYLH